MHCWKIYPVEQTDIERNKTTSDDTTDDILNNTATEYLRDELGFKQSQIENMNIKRVTKTKKAEGKPYILPLKIKQVFHRSSKEQQ